MWHPSSIGDFLKYCKNLRILFLVNQLENHHHDVDWTNSAQSDLRVFIVVDMYGSVNPINLTNFLTLATKLQTISLNNLSAIRCFLKFKL